MHSFCSSTDFFWRVFCAQGTVLAIVYRAVNKADVIMVPLMEAQRLVREVYTEDVHK